MMLADVNVAAVVVELAILASLLVWAVRWARRRAMLRRLAPDARQRYEDARRARKEADKLERAHRGRVKAAERELANARNPKPLSTIVMKGKRFALYPDRIETPEGSQQLTADVVATVDTAGNLSTTTKSRATLTRMAAGTVVAGPVGLLAGALLKKNKVKTTDTRELYLLIDGGTWATMAECDPDKGTEVRAFAQAVMVAARGADDARRQRAAVVERLEHALEVARGDTAALNAARRRQIEAEARAPDLG